jgi:hypothetical protein
MPSRQPAGRRRYSLFFGAVKTCSSQTELCTEEFERSAAACFFSALVFLLCFFSAMSLDF